MRYILVSEEHGVFLGGKIWSKSKGDEAKQIPGAATFSDSDQMTRAILNAPNDLGVKVVTVNPDMSGHRASEYACVQIGVEGWTGNEVKPPAARVSGNLGNDTPRPTKHVGARLFNKGGKEVAQPGRKAAPEQGTDTVEGVKSTPPKKKVSKK